MSIEHEFCTIILITPSGAWESGEIHPTSTISGQRITVTCNGFAKETTSSLDYHLICCNTPRHCMESI